MLFKSHQHSLFRFTYRTCTALTVAAVFCLLGARKKCYWLTDGTKRRVICITAFRIQKWKHDIGALWSVFVWNNFMFFFMLYILSNWKHWNGEIVTAHDCSHRRHWQLSNRRLAMLLVMISLSRWQLMHLYVGSYVGHDWPVNLNNRHRNRYRFKRIILDTALSLVWHQFIIWTDVASLLIGELGKSFSGI